VSVLHVGHCHQSNPLPQLHITARTIRRMTNGFFVNLTCKTPWRFAGEVRR
jgi:hypothetical protein